MNISLRGIIVYDTREDKFFFKHHLQQSDFTNDIYSTDWADYVYICDHSIYVELPSGFDAKGTALAAMEIQEEKLRSKYLSELFKIEEKRKAINSQGK